MHIALATVAVDYHVGFQRGWGGCIKKDVLLVNYVKGAPSRSSNVPLLTNSHGQKTQSQEERQEFHFR